MIKQNRDLIVFLLSRIESNWNLHSDESRIFPCHPHAQPYGVRPSPITARFLLAPLDLVHGRGISVDGCLLRIAGAGRACRVSRPTSVDLLLFVVLAHLLFLAGGL